MILIAICHRCPKRQKDCAGPCACTIDGKDIITHAESRYCPEGRYRLGVGDVLAIVFRKAGLHRLVERVGELLNRPCNCAARQTKLNARWAVFYEWVMEWPGARWMLAPRAITGDASATPAAPTSRT